MVQTAFLPGAHLARQLDFKVKQLVADSLEYVAGQAREQIQISDSALELALQKLRNHEPVSPAVFGSYYDIIISIQQNDLGRVQQGFDLLAKIDQDTPRLVIRAFSPSDLGQEKFDIYNQFSDCDPENPLNLIPPGEDDFLQTQSQFQDAMKLLDKAAPALADEIRELLYEIVIADQVQPVPRESQVFGSLSSPYLWGAAFMKADSYTTLEAVVTIIHEYSHLLLFALSRDGHMANNPYDQRLDSPIRSDKRPMEGIYHATFVLARMCHGVKTLLESDVLDDQEMIEGTEILANLQQCFEQGLATVEDSADLTEQGREIMDITKAYMQQSGAIALAV